MGRYNGIDGKCNILENSAQSRRGGIIYVIYLVLVLLTLSHAHFNVMEVVGETKSISRLSYDPVSLQPRKDVFDATYIAAYFSKPLYISAFDGQRYRLQDILESGQYQHVFEGLSLECGTDDTPSTSYTFTLSPSIYSQSILQRAEANDSVLPSQSSLVAPQPQAQYISEWFSAVPVTKSQSLLSGEVDDDSSWGMTSNMLPLMFITRYNPTRSFAPENTFSSRLQAHAKAAVSIPDLSVCKLVIDESSRLVSADGSHPKLSSFPIVAYRGIPLTHYSAIHDIASTSTSTSTATSSATNSPASASLSLRMAHAQRARCEVSSFTHMNSSSSSSSPTSFLELDISATNPLLEPSIQMFLGDATEQMTDLLLGSTAAELVEDIQHAIAGPMAHQVVTYVGKAVARNLTNLIIPAVSGHLVKLLSTSLPNMISGPLQDSIVTSTAPVLKQRLIRTLSQTLPNSIYYGLPELLARSLPIILTSKLTRSLTHAIVPSLSRALSVTYHYSYLCHLCTHFSLHCSDCNDLQVSQHQIQYYAAHYSEYYSGYYGDYYRDALYMLDQLQSTTWQASGTDPLNMTPKRPEVNFQMQSTGTPAEGDGLYAELVIKAARAAASAASNTQPEFNTLGGVGSAGYAAGNDRPGALEIIVDTNPNGAGPNPEKDHVYIPKAGQTANRLIPDAQTDPTLPTGTSEADVYTKMQEKIQAVEADRAAYGQAHYKRWGSQKDYIQS